MTSSTPVTSVRCSTSSTLAGNGAVDMLATQLLILDDATGAVSDSHPLRRKFRRGTQVVDLSRHPEYIRLQSASAFYRTADLLGQGLTSIPPCAPTSRTPTSLPCTSPPTIGRESAS